MLEPRNILVIHFGQLGDVVLGVPALRALRHRFATAKITIAVGKSCASVVKMATFFDETIIVDRAGLRAGATLASIWKILQLVHHVRTQKFDFVIDLHSLSETNLLGFVSGAPRRLYSNRENRSLDFLANVTPKPPQEDKSRHITDRYLDVLTSLGVAGQPRFVLLEPHASDVHTVRALWQANNLTARRTIGVHVGAGHPSRRWSLANFSDLVRQLSAHDDLQVVVFLGPEERHLHADIERSVPRSVTTLAHLTLTELAAAFAQLDVLVGNDSGPIHIGAVVGTPIVLIMDERAPTTFLPLTEKIQVIRSGRIDDIRVADVYGATLASLHAAPRRA
jgi:ADP-heptose:LPS heptosyltransferase